MKEKPKPSRLKKIIILAVVLVALLIFTNPAVLFFLPENTKAKLLAMWSNIFGNVDAIKKTLEINWISIFQVAVIIIFLLIVSNIIKLVLERIKPKTGRGKSLMSMVRSFSTYAIALIGIIWCLSVIGINLSTIFASIGIVALIIGFAAENLIEDIITGIFLVFEDEFNVGDIIEFNGFRGTVTNIGVRVTYIEDAGGNIKIVNNSDIRGILNRSKAASVAICDVPVSYAADLEETEKVVCEIIANIPAKYPGLFKYGVNYLGVQALDASSVNLRISAHVDEAEIFKATRTLNREIKIGLDKAGVEIPFQQVVIHKAGE